MEEEGAMSWGMQAASKNWKQQENRFSIEPLQRHVALPTSFPLPFYRNCPCQSHQ